MRKIISFVKNWLFAKSDEMPVPVALPHTWNANDGQDGGNDYWRGKATYIRQFQKPALADGERCYLEINGAAMTAEVCLNEQKLCRHEGGYSTFRVDLTDRLADQNELMIFVDNSENDHVYPQKADFTFYGGLYREINLVIVPAAHFELVKDGTPGCGRLTPGTCLTSPPTDGTRAGRTA